MVEVEVKRRGNSLYLLLPAEITNLFDIREGDVAEVEVREEDGFVVVVYRFPRRA